MSKKLTSKQHKALAALIDGANYEQAAALTGVTTRTLRRYRSDPLFVAELRRLEGAKLGELSLNLTRASNDALAVLEAVMHDDDTPASVKVRAADSILSHRRQIYELVSLTDRIDEIEARLNNEHQTTT